MALNFQDQNELSLGGSQIQPRDTYVRPRVDPNAGNGMMQLARALEGFGGTLKSEEAQKADQEKLMLPGIVADIQSAITRNGAYDAGLVNDRTSKLHTANAAFVNQMVGVTLGDQLVSSEALPEDIYSNPAAADAWKARIMEKAKSQYGKDPFLYAGVATGVDKALNAKTAGIDAQRNADDTKRVIDGLDTSLRGLFKAPYSFSPTYADNPDRARGVIKMAERFKLQPDEVGTFLADKTGGTMDLDQFFNGLTKEEQSAAGYQKGTTNEAKMKAVENYLVSRGLREGMGLKDLYRITGSPDVDTDGLKDKYAPQVSRGLGLLGYDQKAPVAAGIAKTAEALGISPIDLATAISYETGGTFNPTQAGPRTQWGQHRGLIQFGEPQAKKYGVDWNDPINSQLGANGAIAKYLIDAGVKPGMGLLDIYSAINAGGVGRYNASDANNGGAPGTVADKVNFQMADHRKAAEKLFGRTQVAQADTGTMSDASQASSSTYASLPWKAKALLSTYADLDGQIKAVTNGQAAYEGVRARVKVQAAQAFMDAAIEDQDVRILAAFPQNQLDPDLKQKFDAVAAHIQQAKENAANQAWQDSVRQQAIAKQSNQAEMAQFILNKQEPDAKTISQWTARDPEAVKEWANYKSTQASLLNPTEEQRKFSAFQDQVRKSFADGQDPRSLDLGQILDPSIRKQAAEFAQSYVQNGGEYTNKFYDDFWQEQKRITWGVTNTMGGQTVSDPKVRFAEQQWYSLLEEKINEHIAMNNGAPITRVSERMKIANEVLDQLLKSPAAVPQNAALNKGDNGIPGDAVKPANPSPKFKFGQ